MQSITLRMRTWREVRNFAWHRAGRSITDGSTKISKKACLLRKPMKQCSKCTSASALYAPACLLFGCFCLLWLWLYFLWRRRIFCDKSDKKSLHRFPKKNTLTCTCTTNRSIKQHIQFIVYLLFIDPQKQKHASQSSNGLLNAEPCHRLS